MYFEYTNFLGGGLQFGFSSNIISQGILLLLQWVKSNPSSAQIDCLNLQKKEIFSAKTTRNGLLPTWLIELSVVFHNLVTDKAHYLYLWSILCNRTQVL